MDDPQRTVVPSPIQLRIADDIRMQIEGGDLAPGDPLPTLHELAARWGCSVGSARAAISLLKQQGLISGGRGRPPYVRIKPRPVVRSSERHQAEKDLALATLEERSAVGEAETNISTPLHHFDFHSDYSRTSADDRLAEMFGVELNTELLRRTYETIDPETGYRQTWSVSYLPIEYIDSNPELLDAKNEPWPGGTMHQLRTVDIEVATVVDEVTARMPTTVEQQLWGLEDGIPLLSLLRSSIDVLGRVVEASRADYPADRTTMRFVTSLTSW